MKMKMKMKIHLAAEGGCGDGGGEGEVGVGVGVVLCWRPRSRLDADDAAAGLRRHPPVGDYTLLP